MPKSKLVRIIIRNYSSAVFVLNEMRLQFIRNLRVATKNPLRMLQVLPVCIVFCCVTFLFVILSYPSKYLFRHPMFSVEIPAETVLNTFLLDTPPQLLPLPRDRGNEPIKLPDKGIVFCWIPKNMCTQMKALFCRIYLGYKGDAGTNADEFGQIHDACFFYLSLINRTDAWEMEDTAWKKWVIVRDPIERLVSAWLDKCSEQYTKNKTNKCYTCQQDFNCFVRRNFIRLTERSLNMTSYYPEHMDHFWPQSWFCGYRHQFQQYDRIFVYNKSERFKLEIRKAFRDIQLGKFVDGGWGPNHTKPFLERSTLHVQGVKSKSVAQYFRNDLALADLAYRTYLIDYVSFGLQKPQWTQELCQKNAKVASLYLLCSSLTMR